MHGIQVLEMVKVHLNSVIMRKHCAYHQKNVDVKSQLTSTCLLCPAEKLAEATRKYATLKSELSEAQEEEFNFNDDKRSRLKSKLLQKKDSPARKIQELKLAFSEFYLSLILLQNYQNLNFTGFRKILKKHDKVIFNTSYVFRMI